MKKLALTLILIILALPIFARADEHDKSKNEQVTIDNLDWTISEPRGLLLEVSSDSLFYEERWMRLLPVGGSVSDQSNETIELDLIKAPCLVDISYGGKGKKCYVIRLRVISEQLNRDANGDIVVPHPTNE